MNASPTTMERSRSRQENVSGRVSLGVDPAPLRKKGNTAVGWEWLEVLAHIDRSARIEAGERGHHSAANAGIGGGIALTTIEIGKLARVREDRNAPAIGQRLEGADVIEVAVCHDDSGRGRVLSEAIFRTFFDGSGGAG